MRVLLILLLASPALAQEIDWKSTAAEAAETLRSYIRFDTTVPPGDVTEAAAFLQGILEREGLGVERYEAAPGKITLVARLKALIHRYEETRDLRLIGGYRPGSDADLDMAIKQVPVIYDVLRQTPGEKPAADSFADLAMALRNAPANQPGGPGNGRARG